MAGMPSHMTSSFSLLAQELLSAALREKGRMFNKVQLMRSQQQLKHDGVRGPENLLSPEQSLVPGKGTTRLGGAVASDPRVSRATPKTREPQHSAPLQTASPQAGGSANPRPQSASSGRAGGSGAGAVTPASQARSAVVARRLSLGTSTLSTPSVRASAVAATPSGAGSTAVPNPWGAPPPPLPPSSKPYSPLHYLRHDPPALPSSPSDDPLPLPRGQSPPAPTPQMLPLPCASLGGGGGSRDARGGAPAAGATDASVSARRQWTGGRAPQPDPPAVPPPAASASPPVTAAAPALSRLMRPLLRRSRADADPKAGGGLPSSAAVAVPRSHGTPAERPRFSPEPSSRRRHPAAQPSLVPGLRRPGSDSAHGGVAVAPRKGAAAAVDDDLLCETLGGCSTITGSGEGADVASVPPPAAVSSNVAAAALQQPASGPLAACAATGGGVLVGSGPAESAGGLLARLRRSVASAVRGEI